MQSVHKTVKGGRETERGTLTFREVDQVALGWNAGKSLAKVSNWKEALHPQPVHPVGPPPLIQPRKMCSKFIQRYFREMRELDGMAWSNTLFPLFDIQNCYLILSGCLWKWNFAQLDCVLDNEWVCLHFWGSVLHLSTKPGRGQASTNKASLGITDWTMSSV